MALPAGITTATVTWGPFTDFFGNPASVSVQIQPVLGGNAHSLAYNGQTLDDFAQTISAAAGTQATWLSPHVNQSGFTDGSGNAFTNWSYLAVATVRMADGQTVTLRKAYQAVTSQSTVDLDALPDGTVGGPSSSPVPAVTSVNGLTGAVVVSTSGSGLDETALVAKINDTTPSATRAALTGVIQSTAVTLAGLPAGAVIYSSSASTRPSARTDLLCVFATATDPNAAALTGDIWIRTAS